MRVSSSSVTETDLEIGDLLVCTLHLRLSRKRDAIRVPQIEREPYSEVLDAVFGRRDTDVKLALDVL